MTKAQNYSYDEELTISVYMTKALATLFKYYGFDANYINRLANAFDKEPALKEQFYGTIYNTIDACNAAAIYDHNTVFRHITQSLEEFTENFEDSKKGELLQKKVS